jgi:aryl carrier-like protein
MYTNPPGPTEDNVIYAYIQGEENSAYVTISPEANGDITILKEFTVDGTTYQVTSIGQDALNGNILSSVTFPYDSQITSIGTRAFYNSGLETLHIPDSVTSIGESAFELNKISTFTGGINIETIGIRAFASNKLTSLTIPNKVKIMSSSAFSSNSLITVMFLGSDVETIGTQAFQGNSLTKLFIPKSVSSLGASAFRNNKLTEVYFFNVPSIGINCFTGNISSMKAYYLDGLPNNDIVTPLPFVSKTSQTLVQMLKPLLDETGVSVETLVNDDYTFIQIAEAEATASQLFGYFDNIPSPVPLSSYIPYFSVSALKTAKPSLTIDNFKTAGAPIQQVFDQFKTVLPRLSAMIGAEYTVSEIAANVTASPILTAGDFKAALAFIQDVFDEFGLSGETGMITAGYTVQEIVADVSPAPSIGDFKTALASIQEVFDQYKTVGEHRLSEMIGANYSVSQIADNVITVPAITIADFKNAGALIQQVYSYYGLTAMIAAGYIVSDIKAGVTSIALGYSDFYGAGASAVNLMTEFDYNLLLPNFTVSQIKDASSNTSVKASNRPNDSPLTAENFKTHNAPIWQMLNAFSLSILTPLYTTQELFDASNEKVSGVFLVTVTAYQDLTAQDMKTANDELWQIMNVYSLADLLQVDYSVAELVTASNDSGVTVTDLQDLGNKLSSFVAANATVITRGEPSKLGDMIDNFELSDLLGYYSVLTLKTAKTSLAAGDFKAASALIQDVFDQYPLSEMIAAEYSVQEIIADVTPLQTIAQFKTASAPIQEVFDQYGLTGMIAAGYTVSEIVADVSPPPSIGDFKDASADEQEVFDQYKTVGEHRLSEMIGANYSVSQIADNVITVPAITIADFKTASAPIQQVYSYYGLTAMIAAGYIVSDIKAGVTSIALGYSDFYNAGASAVNLMTEFDYTVLKDDFTVSQIKAASSDTSVKASNRPNDSPLTAQNFKDYNAPIWQMLNAFTLSELTSLYTTQQLFDASNEKVSGVFLVTVTAYQELTAQDMKTANDQLWEMMNVYSLADLLQVDYSVDDLVTASNQVDDNGVRLVTVIDLQDLGNKLASFVTANATVITNTTVSRLWNLVNYFSLSDLLGQYSVAELNETSSDSRVLGTKTVTLASLKAADTDESYTQDMLTEFGLQAMYGAGYIVTQLKAVNVTVSQFWVLTSEKPTVQDLFTGGYVLQDLWNGIVTSTRSNDVATIYDGLTETPTVAQWWALINGKPTVQQLSDSTKYGLQQLWEGIDDVSTIKTGLTPAPTVAEFKALTSPPTIQELFDGGYILADLVSQYTVSEIVANVAPLQTIAQFKTASAHIQEVFDQYGLSEMIGAQYTVSEIVVDVTPLQTITDFKSVSAPIQQVFDQYGLSDMIDELYTVSEIVSDVSPAPTIAQFKSASAPIQEVFDQYELSDMIAAGYTVSQIVADVTPLQTITNFKSASAPIQEVFDQYGLTDMIDELYTVSEIVADVTPLQTIAQFKTASAPIQEVFDQYGLTGATGMIAAQYTVQEIIADVSPDPSIGDFKSASAPIQEVFDQYGLTDMIDELYTVSEIVADVTPLQTIAQFKTASAPIQEVFDQYGLSDMIAAGYTVQEIIAGVTPVQTIAQFKTASAPIQEVFDQYGLTGATGMIAAGYIVVQIVGSVTPVQTIAQFKTASAPIQQVFDHYGLTEMIAAGYIVSDIKAGVTSIALGYSDFYNAGASAVNLMTEFDYNLLKNDFTVSQIKAASSDTSVKASNSTLTAQKFKHNSYNAPIWQMLNAFSLSELTPLYTTQELFNASNQNDSGVFLVTVEAYQELTASDMKTANDELWQMMNVYSLADLLQVDYSVAELVTASNQVDDNGNRLVTVTDLQNLGSKLSSFVAANATVISNTTVSRLWNLVNYFSLSDLLGEYSVAELNETSSDLRVSETKTVTLARLKAADTAESYTQDMLTEFGLQAMYAALYTVDQLKAVNVTVAQWWALNPKPTVQQLFVGGYVLQDLWNGIVTSTRSNDVVTIYDELTAKPTVAQWWALINGKPTVQQLSDSTKYGLQQLWEGIVTPTRSNDVSTIRTGLTPTPTVTQFKELTGAPTVKQLSEGGYTLTELIAAPYTVNEIRNTTTGIGNSSQQTPTLAEFKAANAPLWQLLNCPLYRTISDAVGMNGFPLGHFIKVGYKVQALVEASNLKDSVTNQFLVDQVTNWQNLTPHYFNPDYLRYISDSGSNETIFTDDEKMDILCDILSYFEPGQVINVATDGTNDSYYKVPKMIEASKATDGSGNYKVTNAGNRDLDTVINRFITNIVVNVNTKVSSGLLHRILRYKTKFTPFSIITFEAAYNVGQILDANGFYNDINNNNNLDKDWDADNDWRVSLADLKLAGIPTTRMVQYYMGGNERSNGLQTLWDLKSTAMDPGYSVSELRTASDAVFTDIYGSSESISVQYLLALSSNTTVHRARPTIRQIDEGGYNLERLTVGLGVGGSLDPLIDVNTGMLVAPTVADFYNKISADSNHRPTVQQLYDTFGLQSLFNELSIFNTFDPINKGIKYIKSAISGGVTVAQWWALTPKPTVEQLFSNGEYVLQELWNGINDVAAIYELTVKPTVAQWWGLDPKPTVQQLSVKYSLQELWNGIVTSTRSNDVSTIRTGLTTKPTVAQWLALTGGKPTINELSVGGYLLQNLWDDIASVSTVYDELTAKPTVAQWWALSTEPLLHLVKPTVQQLSVKYSLQELWLGIVSVSTIKTGLSPSPTVAQWWALTGGKPTIQELYSAGYLLPELIAGDTGITLLNVLSAVSDYQNSTVASIITDLKALGYKMNIPAPRITSGSYISGSVNLTVVQPTADITIEKYLVSYTYDGGLSWSEYAVVTDSISGNPLLPNNSGVLIISGIQAKSKIHSFRLKAEGAQILSNASNTFRNLFF